MVLTELKQDDPLRGTMRNLYAERMTAVQLDSLIEIAGRYRYNLETGKAGPSRMAARENLELALKHLEASGHIIGLNRVAESWFIDALWALPRKMFREDVATSRMTAYLEGKLPQQISKWALETTLVNIKAKRGALPNIAVFELVDNLCGLYKDLFGLPVTTL